MLPNEPSLRTRKGNYYLVFYDAERQPKQKWVPLRTKTERTATRRAAPLTADYMQGTFDPWTDDPEATTPVVEAAVATYLEARKPDLSTRTWRTYKYDLTPYADRFGSRRLDRVTPDEILEWCRRGDVSKRTVQKRLTELKTLYAHFFDRNRIEDDPTDGLSVASPDVDPPRYLTRTEYETLEAEIRAYTRSHADEGDGPTYQQAPLTWLLRGLQLMVSTGLRRGSMIGLEWADVDLEDRLLYVRSDTAKTGGHTVPLFDRARKALAALGPSNSGLVLTRQDGSAVPPRTFTRQFNRFAAKAELQDVSPHTCRHTFASWLVQAGVSLYKVSAWLGHSSIEVTERYAHLAPTQSDDTAEQVFS